MGTIKIGDRIIGDGYPVYIIAELSANHAGKIENAKKIIKAAKECGADCVKVQTYTPDTITINCSNQYFQIQNGTWKGQNLYDLYKDAYTPWEWQEELKEYAENLELDFFSTPFDRSSVDFLEKMNVQAYKIASFEFIDIPLIEYVASKNKPIIFSTGMASYNEIEEALSVAKNNNNTELALLRCSSAYPAIYEDMNLATIPHMKEAFNVPVGLSDHSMGSLSAIVAVSMGASIIEKHLCLSRKVKNPDSTFSMEPDEFKSMVAEIRNTETLIGKVSYSLSDREKENIIFRRSIFAVRDICKGEKFSEDTIRCIRPGYGLKPKYYGEILNKYAKTDIKKGTPISFDLVCDE